MPETKARNWQGRVDDLPNVGKLVHLAMRMTGADVDRIKGELTKHRRRAYEDELTIQAGRVGCPGRRGRLTAGPSLSELSNQSQRDAESIVNTYNYDLSLAIEHIRAETPSANRHVYARRLSEWEQKRAAWKSAQISQYSEGTARALAQADFRRFNDITGYANLKPETAVCPVCQGWVKRGDVELQEAQNHPPPYHPNCPHLWVTFPNQVPKSECPVLLMGD